MASGTGTVTIDFGALPGSNEAEAIVTGLGDIAATAKCEAWVMGDDSSVDHTAADHRYLPLFACFTCGAAINGVGFTIYARASQKLMGAWTVRYVWVN